MKLKVLEFTFNSCKGASASRSEKLGSRICLQSAFDCYKSKCESVKGIEEDGAYTTGVNDCVHSGIKSLMVEFKLCTVMFVN
jgi:hypothetical protein